MKVALRDRKVRAVKVFYSIKYCLGLDSNGHVDLRLATKQWLAEVHKVSLRTINRDLRYLQDLHLLKEDSRGWRVAGSDRIHWNIMAQTGVDQMTAVESRSREGKEFRGKKRVSTKVRHFKMKLNLILVGSTKLRNIFTTLIVGKNLRAQAFRQLQTMIKAGRVPKKWRNIENLLSGGQWLSGEALAEILGVTLRQAYVLRQHAHLHREARIFIEPGCRDKDVLLALGRAHYGIKSGGVVYAGPDGTLVFRIADLLSAKYTGSVSSGRFIPHWAKDQFKVGGNTLHKKDHFDKKLSNAMNNDLFGYLEKISGEKKSDKKKKRHMSKAEENQFLLDYFEKNPFFAPAGREKELEMVSPLTGSSHSS